MHISFPHLVGEHLKIKIKRWRDIFFLSLLQLQLDDSTSSTWWSHRRLLMFLNFSMSSNSPFVISSRISCFLVIPTIMQKHKRLQLIDFIFLVSFVLELSQCLPVTSKALENNPEQLIWQTSWFSQEQGEDMGSPFIAKDLKKVKKITAKSIFILPDFEKNDKCDDGFKPDENGKCIRVASLSNRGERLRYQKSINQNCAFIQMNLVSSPLSSARRHARNTMAEYG